MSHQALVVTSHLTLHALMRVQQNDPCFSIREIDMKLLRHATTGKKKTLQSSSNAQLNEQAARVKARQLMLSYATHLLEANKDEIRWLKDSGVLGKRAPKSSLMSATFLLQLLREQNKTALAAHLQNALVNAKIGKWRTHSLVEISEEDAAAEAEAALAQAKHLAEEEEAAAAAAEEAADEENGHGHTMEDDSQDEPPPPPEPRSRRRSSASSKRKSYSPSRYDDDSADEEDQQSRRKRSRRSTSNNATSSSSGGGHGGYSTTNTPNSMSTHGAPSSAGVSPISLTSPRHPNYQQPTHPPASSVKPPPNMSVARAMLMLNPRDRQTGAASIHFGQDRTSTMHIASKDGCTIVGPARGTASARATHGITSGSWYIEVKGTEAAAEAMRDTMERSGESENGSSSASASLLEQEPPHCRIGFATSHCPLDVKALGHDEFSYAYGDRYGDKIHEGEAAEYGSSFGIFQMDQQEERQAWPLVPGDTIGMLIELGVSNRQSDQPPSSSGGSSPTSPSTGNRISFYKNHVLQGVAWNDLPSGHTWYPAVSLINGMACTFDFQVNMASASPAVHHPRHPSVNQYHSPRNISAASSGIRMDENSGAPQANHRDYSVQQSHAQMTYHREPQQHHRAPQQLQPMYDSLRTPPSRVVHAQSHNAGVLQQPQRHSNGAHAYQAVGSYPQAGAFRAQSDYRMHQHQQQQQQILSHEMQHQRTMQMAHERKIYQQQIQQQASGHAHNWHGSVSHPQDHSSPRHGAVAGSIPYSTVSTLHSHAATNNARMAELQQMQMDVQQQQLLLQQQQRAVMQQHQQQSMVHHPSPHVTATSHMQPSPPIRLHSSSNTPSSQARFQDSSPRVTGIYQVSGAAANTMQPMQLSDDYHHRSPSLAGSSISLLPSSSPSNYTSSMPPSIVGRQLRVPSTEDETTSGTHITSAILQPSPSPSPAFPLPLISPAPSPTPLVNPQLPGSGSSGIMSYSLSTTPMPMESADPATIFSHANSSPMQHANGEN